MTLPIATSMATRRGTTLATTVATTLAAALLACAPGTSARGDEVADFFKGKTITITSAGGAGGGYGIYAQLIADHISKYIPGSPNLIVNFNSNAGGLSAGDYIFNVAPKDGTAILAPLQSMSTLQVVGVPGIRFDSAKFQWVGRAAETTSGFVVRSQVADGAKALMARSGETVIGVTHIGAPNQILPAILAHCPGFKLKLVSGYPSSAPLALAFERSEIDGVALPLDSLRTAYPGLLKQTLVAQSGFKRARDLPNVPLATELCTDAERRKVVEFFQVQEEMGRAYALPPGTPPARVAALRAAFDKVMQDPALLAVAKGRKLDINPLPGAEVQKLVERHVATDPALVATAKKVVGIK